MTPELISIATRIRDFIARSSRGTGVSPVCSSPDQFNALALELFCQQFHHNAAYRRICEARGILPGSVEHWMRIPTVPTAAFKEFELTCLAPAGRTAVFYSSGTTEQRRSRHFHSPESLALYEDSLWAWFERRVLSASTVGGYSFAVLTPPPAAAPNSSLVHMFQTICRQCQVGDGAYLGGIDVDGAWTLHFERVEAIIRVAATEGRRLVLLGTAFNFVHLLDELAARNLHFKLPAGSIVMETGGYKGRSRELPKVELHALITRTLGVPRSQIICEYGMSELSSQAYDCNMGVETRNPKLEARNFSFPPWARAQIISPESGREVAEDEIGMVRIFDLANAFSVLAVQTEDLAIRRPEGFELVGRAVAAEARGCSLMTV